ncbi:MAG: hypothetical protein QOH63_1979 [Acidobacteriota bacterium]|jgi:hypothetical protein|nr:hypothetical protein [Acidobacteriota bacterium]
MTEAEVQAFCANNGISVSPVGQPLFVVDPTQLPQSVRVFVGDDGKYIGDGTPKAEDARHEESKGAPDQDETAIAKGLGDDEVKPSEEAEVDSEESGASLPQGKLPDDLPGHAALEAEGVTTYAQLRKRISAGTLIEIPGIGDATAAKIKEALGEEA